MRKRNRIPIIVSTLVLSASVFAGGLVMTNAASSDDGCYEDKYFNAHQAYEGLISKRIPTTHITHDTKCNQIWWVRQHHDAEENKLSQDPNKKNEGCVGYVLGWRVVISATDTSNKSHSMTCDVPDVELDEFKAVTEFTDANKSQHCENEKKWYTLYALDLNTLYDYMYANDKSTAEKINQCSSANITIYPIATYRAGIADPAGSVTYDEKGISGTEGKVYYGDNKTEWDEFDAFLMAKNGRTYDEFTNSGFFQRTYDGTVNIEPGECTYRFELGDSGNTNLEANELNFKPGWTIDEDGYLYHNNQLYKSYHELLKTDPLLDASEFSAGEDAANLRTGYTILDKWYVNGSENIAGDFGARNYGRNIKDAKGNTASEVLTCKWKEHSYTIEFDSNGGNGFVPQIQTNYSKPEILNSGTGLYRDGYNFIGWSTNQRATEPDPGKEAGATVSKLVPSDGTSIKLYAVWQPGEYDITLKKEGGTGGTDSVVEKYGEFFGLKDGNGSLSKIDGINAPVKVGHIFSGYFSGAMGTKR